MKVGFLNNQIDNRGTGNAVFDYAHYNETILGNESLIFTWKHGAVDPLMERRVVERFGGFHYIESLFGDEYKKWNLDVLYHIKYGNDTNTSVALPGTRYVVHAVFDASYPHGDRFAVVSHWLREAYNHPWVNPFKDKKEPPAVWVVPHIVEMPRTTSTLKEELGIPEDATVFGRHGGFDSFDIPWVWDTIREVLRWRDDIYFVFLNTDAPEWAKSEDNIYLLPETADPNRKSAFIRTCDAMLHARQRGETFGIAVGEFDAHFKPVITYGKSSERNHINTLHEPIMYFSPTGLFDILTNWNLVVGARHWSDDDGGYWMLSPTRVMKQFKEVFLDD